MHTQRLNYKAFSKTKNWKTLPTLPIFPKHTLSGCKGQRLLDKFANIVDEVLLLDLLLLLTTY